ncbi:VOC family protein, partial [Streptomyces boluensis]
MTSHVRHLTYDSHDAYAQAEFWAQVLGGKVSDEDAPGDPEALVEWAGVPFLFVTVPEAKSVKNRLHVDLQPQDRTRDEEVTRLLALGARPFADHRTEDGRGWVTLTDPEGNEFCVERSVTERAVTESEASRSCR